LSLILTDYDNGYPMSTDRVPTRKLVIAGRYKKLKQIQAERNVPVLVVPPVQTDEERGQGDSINAKMHRILNG
jgi:hypothetical protein